MKKQTFPAKIYWKEIPENRSQLKDILLHGEYQQPAKVLNSTEVTAEAKPWLLKKVTKLDQKKTMHYTDKEHLKLKAKPKYHHTVDKATKNPVEVTLKDLRQEDKQKVANLIRELAKSGNEKEQALQTLKSIKTNYGVKIKQLQEEKEHAIKKHDSVKEKLLEYEILIEQVNIKESGVLGNTKNVNKFNSLEKDVSDIAEGKLETDNFSELFIEQQQKFYKQQTVLQEQIEHLQKLQESILKQQSKEFHQLQERSSDENLSSKTYSIKVPTVGSFSTNTQKLESYIQSETSVNHQKEDENLSKETSSRKNINGETKRNSYTKTICNNIAPGFPNESTPMFHKTTVDMCVQTEVPTQTLNKDIRLHNCEKNISKLQESLLNLSQSYSDTPSMIASSNASVENRSSFKKKKQDLHATLPLHNTLLLQASNSGGSRMKTLSTTTFPYDKNSDSDRDSEEVHFLINPSSSAVKRRHFQPSSILDLVEGIQPRSTSTSVDQHSLQQKQLVLNRKPNKLKSNHNSKAEKPKQGFDEDAEERNMLEDIFFLK